MFKRRQTRDYRDFVEFEKVNVEKWLDKAKEFVRETEQIASRTLEQKHKNQNNCEKSKE